MLVEVISDNIAGLPKKTIVTALAFYKRKVTENVFDALQECSFEESDFIRLSTIVGNKPSTAFKNLQMTITNKENSYYNSTFDIEQINCSINNISFIFETGILDPISITSIICCIEGNLIAFSLADCSLSFINNEELESHKKYLKYIDREEYQETFSSEWENDLENLVENSATLTSNYFFIHNTGTMTLKKNKEYPVIKFMKKTNTGVNEEVSIVEAKTAQILGENNYPITVLLRNGNIVEH